MTDTSDEKPEQPDAIRRPGLARSMEGGLQRDLDAMISDRLMANADIGSAIARDLDTAAGLALPTLNDIQGLSEKPASGALQSVEQIEALLSLDKVGDLASEGNRLNDLLDRGAATLEERNILRRGMAFLRNKMHREAAEWWQLNTPADRSAPFALLLQLLLALTYRTQGDETRAAVLLSKLKPDLDRLTGGGRP